MRLCFDLVLMDVQMPEIDGREATVALRIREAQTERGIQIIAMTAHAMKGNRERRQDAGIENCMASYDMTITMREITLRPSLEIRRPTGLGIIASPGGYAEY